MTLFPSSPHSPKTLFPFCSTMAIFPANLCLIVLPANSYLILIFYLSSQNLQFWWVTLSHNCLLSSILSSRNGQTLQDSANYLGIRRPATFSVFGRIAASIWLLPATVMKTVEVLPATSRSCGNGPSCSNCLHSKRLLSPPTAAPGGRHPSSKPA